MCASAVKSRVTRLWFALCASACVSTAAPVDASVLNLPVDEFNAPDKAWRIHEAAGDFQAAAELLESYLAKQSSVLPEYERTLMHFHVLQMYAARGDNSRALAHANLAKFVEEPADWPLRWNAYVDATVAFLKEDRAAFARAREEILSGPRQNGVPPNLNVVARLEAHFGQPYRAAYGFPAPAQRRAPAGSAAHGIQNGDGR